MEQIAPTARAILLRLGTPPRDPSREIHYVDHVWGAWRSTDVVTVRFANHRRNPTRVFLGYSFRRATMGSMREARNAGKYPARSAQATRIAAETPIASGSLGPTPNKNDFTKAVVL